jgi:helicase SWR1
LTGADTVVFYDSDFNPQMDRQCEDRAHRIGQIRDVHIYRFVSQHTVEEALLRKANQKRHLDDMVIQKGEFDWRSLFKEEGDSALTKALGAFEDEADAHAAVVAAKEANMLEGADEADFEDTVEGQSAEHAVRSVVDGAGDASEGIGEHAAIEADEEDDEGTTVIEYMLDFVQRDWDFFQEWRI